MLSDAYGGCFNLLACRNAVSEDCIEPLWPR